MLDLSRRGAFLALLLAVGCASGGGESPQGTDVDSDAAPSGDGDGDGTGGSTSGSSGSSGGGTKSDGGGTKRDATVPSNTGTADAGGLKDSGPSVPSNPSKPSDPSKPVADASVPDVAPAASIPQGPHTAAGFVKLAPPLGDPLDPKKASTATPAAPAGWTWFEIPGAVCRDGSPTGIYVRFADSDSLLFYLEGGGACTSPDFCTYNPKNVNEVLAGSGETLFGSVGGAVPGRQQPGVDGIFNTSNSANPFGKWSMVYVPYCTGDVHFGTKSDGSAPGVAGKQQYVGYHNMEKFVARIVPTFKDKVKRVVLTGASAGGFGTLLNYSMVQDSFGDDIWVTALNDSGPSFDDAIQPACMQKRWRDMWGFAGSLPKDCTECQQADGGGLGKLATYLQRKHPNFRLALVSSVHDEVIRAFYAMGLDNCSGFDTASPVPAALGFTFSDADYQTGLMGIRTTYAPTNKFASYYINGFLNNTFHQHTWRPRFYEAAQGNVTIAQWTSDFLAGKMTQVGP
ncbi:MAG: hypothetical protein JWN48_5161 [Myxococcaceae bacterium]|nr:hypothetical protein [Myxococcaceae bacterium]